MCQPSPLFFQADRRRKRPPKRVAHEKKRSGLSSLDRVTARSLAAVLQAGISNPAIANAYVDSLAAAGGDGTLEQRLPTLGTRLRGKTGTTDLACSLSGLIDRRIAFVVIENGNPVPAWTARTAQDRFVTVLASRTP